MLPISTYAAFIDIPEHGFKDSAYIACEVSGEFGAKVSSTPISEHEACHIVARGRKADESPIKGFEFRELALREVFLPEQYGDSTQQAAQVYDYYFSNQGNTECIYATLIHLNDVKLKNGENWEINDITRGGFAGRPVSVAYFFSFHPRGIRSTENVFRIGRTHTSVRRMAGEADLPSNKNAPPANQAISTTQSANPSSNWVDFTTDLNANDPDGISYVDSSIMYIKTTCEGQNPAEYPDAIRLRTTGQNGQSVMEIRLPGFAPPGAVIEQY